MQQEGVIMIKSILVIAALSAASAAQAQGSAAAPACPAGTLYAAIRHSLVKPGKWTTYAKAVADHQAWYAKHGNATTTTIVRTLTARGSAPGLSDSDAVTITRYADKAPPPHDAGWDAFTAKYKASSTVKDEMRVCMPVAAR
jgi:D-arabinose 1-dehydrogenase-like Zn-dependent alcohol dehydrogenase